MYVESVIRLTWTPDLIDLAAPFFVGIVQLSIIINMELPLIDWWLYFLAVLLVGVYALEHRMAVRARADQENEHFFGRVSKATWLDHSIPILWAILLALAGVWYSVTQVVGWLVLLAIASTLIMWFYTISKLHKFWMLSMKQE